VGRVLVAVGTELVQFEPSRGVTAVFGGGIAGNTGGALVRIGAALRAFQRDNNANALSHNFLGGQS
jgi:hypothetical protein